MSEEQFRPLESEEEMQIEAEEELANEIAKQVHEERKSDPSIKPRVRLSMLSFRLSREGKIPADNMPRFQNLIIEKLQEFGDISKGPEPINRIDRKASDENSLKITPRMRDQAAFKDYVDRRKLGEDYN